MAQGCLYLYLKHTENFTSIKFIRGMYQRSLACPLEIVIELSVVMKMIIMIFTYKKI